LISNYGGTRDGVMLMYQFIVTKLPGCAAVKASGDPGVHVYGSVVIAPACRRPLAAADGPRRPGGTR
jgi:hypothetical protein